MTLASSEAQAHGRAPTTCVPRILLTTLPFTVNRGDTLEPDYQDVVLPVIALSFDYGTHRVDADEPIWDAIGELAPRDSYVDVRALSRDPSNDGRPRRARDPGRERHARLLLEGH